MTFSSFHEGSKCDIVKSWKGHAQLWSWKAKKVGRRKKSAEATEREIASEINGPRSISFRKPKADPTISHRWLAQLPGRGAEAEEGPYGLGQPGDKTFRGEREKGFQ